MSILVLLLAGVAFEAAPATPTSDAARTELNAATIVVADCFKEQIPQLDDDKSSADIIATAVMSACDTTLQQLDSAYKKSIIAVAYATDGLSERKKRDLATELIAEQPPKLREKMRNLALTAILRARTRKQIDAAD